MRYAFTNIFIYIYIYIYVYIYICVCVCVCVSWPLGKLERLSWELLTVWLCVRGSVSWYVSVSPCCCVAVFLGLFVLKSLCVLSFLCRCVSVYIQVKHGHSIDWNDVHERWWECDFVSMSLCLCVSVYTDQTWPFNRLKRRAWALLAVWLCIHVSMSLCLDVSVSLCLCIYRSNMAIQ